MMAPKTWKSGIRLRFVILLNTVLVTVPFALCWYIFYADRVVVPFYNRGNWMIVALFMILYVIFARVYEAFLISLNRISEMVRSQALSLLFSDGIMFIVLWLLMQHFPNIIPALGTLVIQAIMIVMWSLLAHKWYYAVFPPKPSMIVYNVREGLEELISQYRLEKKFDVRQVLQVDECLKDLKVLESVEVVFISGIQSHERNIILEYCVEHDIQLYVIPCVGDIIMSGAKQVHMFHLTLLKVGRYKPSLEYLIGKRLFDIVISGLAMILLSPVYLVTAIAIKATDGGPVIYKQERLTKDGKRFWLHKFRSMRVDAEKDGVARLSSGDNDDRITPVGRRIRKLRIDELPQFFDIFLGAISIVGPRPERPEIAEEYCKVMPEFNLRLQAKAGLTGYAQVYGKYNTAPSDKLQMDLMYIANPSFLEDLRIFFATVKVLFMSESTEGIDADATTAMTPELTARNAAETEEEERPEKSRENISSRDAVNI